MPAAGDSEYTLSSKATLSGKPMQELALEQWPIERLVEYARNPCRNDDVVDRMCAAISEFGFRIPLVARSDGTVVDGHLRLKAARRLALETVPVVLADDLSEVQIKAFRLPARPHVQIGKRSSFA